MSHTCDVTEIDNVYVCVTCGEVHGQVLTDHESFRNVVIDEIVPLSSSASFVGLAGRMTPSSHVIRMYHNWSRSSSKETRILKVFDVLKKVAVLHRLSESIVQDAKYKYVSLCKLFGHNKPGFIGACVHAVFAENGVPRSAEELAVMFDIKSTVMTRRCKRLQQIMKINVSHVTSIDFVKRFGTTLELDEYQRKKCAMMVQDIEATYLLDQAKPHTRAACCMHLCNCLYDWRMCPQEIAKVCGVNLATIERHCKGVWVSEID